MSLLDKSVVLLPPYATKSIYTVVKEFEHKGTAKVRLRHPKTGSEHAKLVNEIRIAEDAEIAAGHRIEPHEAFQEWFKTQPFYSDLLIQFGDAIFDFERVDQSYRKLPVNIAWITWQHNNAEIDELQKENLRLAHGNTSYYNQAIKQNKIIDDLKKRLDTALKLIPKWREYKATEFMDDWGDGKEYAQKNCANELEQVLKGGAE